VKEYMHTVDVLNQVKPVRSDFAVLGGFEDQILPALLAGTDGSICGLSNIVPKLFVGLLPVHRGA
jgi:2-dehydro-3-deoxy-D-pentonate aldolase